MDDDPAKAEESRSNSFDAPTKQETTPRSDLAEAEAEAALALASVAHSIIPNRSTSPVHTGAPAIPLPLPADYNPDLPICANCNTQTTPLWRRSHDTTQTLCNACALFFKMKGRNRPISLKTDVIKSRNRSKGKSISKDRAGTIVPTAPKVAKSRGESTSRSRDARKSVGKSAPGGADMEAYEDSNTDGASSDVDMTPGRKLRKTNSQDRYPPPPPHAYVPPPHHHQPYPPATVRARSNSRRAQSLDSRPHYGSAPGQARGEGAAVYYPHPPAPTGYQGTTYAPPPEGQFSPYGYPNGYLAPTQHFSNHHQLPSDRYSAIPSQHPHSHQRIPSLTHAQSDSRSQSPSVHSEIPSSINSPTSSASPPLFHNSSHQKQSLAPMAAYPAHPPFAQSPLSSSTTRLLSRPPSPTGANEDDHPIVDDSRRDSNTLAPMRSEDSTRYDEQYGGRGGGVDVRGRGRERVVLPPIDRVALVTSGVVPPIYQNQYARQPSKVGEGSSSGSVSGSSDGMRSPPSKPSSAPAWEEHRRGRSETRHTQSNGGTSTSRGKEREIDEIHELDEEDELNGPIVSYERQERIASAAGTMVGVENGLEGLRVVDLGDGMLNGALQRGRHELDDSRSRSSGGGGSRDRGRDSLSTENRVRSLSRISQSTDHSPRHNGSAHRSASVTSSAGGRAASLVEAENLKLRARVSELTFLNGLLLEKLQQLDLAEKEGSQLGGMEEG